MKSFLVSEVGSAIYSFIGSLTLADQNDSMC